MMQRLTWNKRVAGLLAIVFLLPVPNAILHYFADDNYSNGWPSNTVRNWEQYGLFALKGKAITNPGGFEALSHPQVYAGHQPMGLYPIYLARQLGSWAHADSLPFYFIFTVVLGLSAWIILKGQDVAWFVAAAVFLSPGFTIYILEPTMIPVMMTLPYAALLLPQLEKPALSPGTVFLLWALTFSFTVLNWTTVFGHGILFAYLLVAKGMTRQRIILFAGLAASSLAVVAVISVMAKLADRAATSGASTPFTTFLADYMWGTSGYGTNLTTLKAFTRLAVVGVIGQLPLHLVFAYVVVKQARAVGISWRAFLPLVVSVLGIASLRNYHGHQPWITVPAILLPGLILGLRLLLPNAPAQSEGVQSSLRRYWLRPTVFVLACFAYGMFVTLMYRVHQGQFVALLRLVRDHSARSDTLVVLEKTDPKLVNDAVTLAIGMDRRVLVLKDLSDPRLPREKAVVLSLSDLESLPLLSQTAEPGFHSWPGVQKLLNIYAKRVARRAAGEEHFKPPAPYRLYALVPPKP
jgi:hypothetical protein